MSKLTNEERALKLEELRNIAKSKNGECLSTEYLGTNKKLTFRCEHGHIFEVAPTNIKTNNCWCRECYLKTKYLIEEQKQIRFNELKEFIKSKNGIIISTIYENAEKKLQYKCEFGHIFFISSRNVLRGHWCQECARLKVGDRTRGNIQEFIEIAKSRNGLCLSNEYVTRTTKLHFYCNKCEKDWWTTPSIIKNGHHWCPFCCESKGEKLTKHIIQALTNLKFEKVRPEWLINPLTHYHLELDLYNEQYNIGVEYQGLQHYKSIRIFGGDKKLQMTQRNDKIKHELCVLHNTKLIYVPDIGALLKLKNLKSFLIQELTKHNIPIDENVTLNYDVIYKQ